MPTTRNTSADQLPPGQRERPDFPRFGLPWQVGHVPRIPVEPRLELTGDVRSPTSLAVSELATLERAVMVSDFHCVTTWSHRSLRWGGWRFRDFYERFLVPRTDPAREAQLVIFTGIDGYSACLLLEDALSDSVLLADELDGTPLSLAHGAPLRVVAPDHYGYKNIKHLGAIGIWRDRRAYHPRGLPGQDHPRARVAHEERGLLPAWLLRIIYRPFIEPTIRRAQRALAANDL